MKHLQPATAIFNGAAGNRLVADVYRRCRPAGAAAAWRRADAPCLAAAPPSISRGRAPPPMRSTSAAMATPNGSRTATMLSRISPPMRRRSPRRLTAARRQAADRDRRLARRHRVAARRRRGRQAGHRAGVRRDRAGRHHAARRPERRREDPGLHARRAPRKGSPPLPKPPTRSRPICRIARARARMRG